MKNLGRKVEGSSVLFNIIVNCHPNGKKIIIINVLSICLSATKGKFKISASLFFNCHRNEEKTLEIV